MIGPLLLLGAFEAMILLFLVFQIPRLWRGERNALDNTTEPIQRSAPALFTWFAVLIPLGLGVIAANPDKHGAVAGAFGIAALGWSVIMAPLALLAWGAGRPRRIVPPHLRGHTARSRRVAGGR